MPPAVLYVCGPREQEFVFLENERLTFCGSLNSVARLLHSVSEEKVVPGAEPHVKCNNQIVQ